MPNRYLRESYVESEHVNAVGWMGECFFTRLIVKVDDFGRIEAHPKLLRAKLFPLKLEQVRETDVSRLIAECEKAGLLRLYTVNGKQYIQLLRWERGRASSSKHPEPPTDSGVCLQPPEDSPDSDTDSDTDIDMRSVSEFDQFWKAYPKRKNKGDAEKAWKKVRAPLVTILTAIENQKLSADWQKNNGQFIPYPASWLNGRRWEDEIVSSAELNLNGFEIVDPHSHG